MASTIRKTKKQRFSETIYVALEETTNLETIVLKVERSRSGIIITNKVPGTTDKYVVKEFVGTNIGKVNIIKENSVLKHIERLKEKGVEISSDLIEKLSQGRKIIIKGGGIYPPFGKNKEKKKGLSIKAKKNYGKGNGWK